MDNDLYDLRVTFRVKLKKWRVDDQSDPVNREWSLKVYDRNLGEWVSITHLDRPGEEAYIEDIRQV
jgi:hypothetical protein